MRLAITLAFALLLLSPSPARACDPAQFDTPFELFDRAATVVVAEVTAIGRDHVDLDVEDTLAGSPGSAVRVEASGGSCDPAFAVGARGLLFLDAQGRMVGVYRAFVVGDAWIDALRRYDDATTAAERAAPLVDLAVSKDWSRSFEASFALADRVELLRALDAASIDRIFARLGKVAKDHPLVRVAARLHDARLAPLLAQRRMRGQDDVKALRDVIAAPFEAETDPAELADVIGDASVSIRRRAAAMERCERVHGRTLDRFTEYLWADTGVSWEARADACRVGVHV